MAVFREPRSKALERRRRWNLMTRPSHAPANQCRRLAPIGGHATGLNAARATPVGRRFTLKPNAVDISLTRHAQKKRLSQVTTIASHQARRPDSRAERPTWSEQRGDCLGGPRPEGLALSYCFFSFCIDNLQTTCPCFTPTCCYLPATRGIALYPRQQPGRSGQIFDQRIFEARAMRHVTQAKGARAGAPKPGTAGPGAIVQDGGIDCARETS